jgi:hypothetical protein
MTTSGRALLVPDKLIDALDRTPIPTSPPVTDGFRESLGLSLLDLALRLEHIERLSESLELVDSTHMARSVEVDINLRLLTAAQRRSLAPGGIGGHAIGAAPQESASSIWIPLARQSRKDLAPIVVRDAAGAVLPRLTHYETSLALRYGLARLFRMFLDADPRSEVPGEQLYDLRHVRNRSRWLIEASIGEIVEHGWPSIRAPRPPAQAESRSRRRWVEPEAIRSAAASAVGQLFQSDSPFQRLLDVASSEYLLVVLVPTTNSDVYLKYEAPLLPAKQANRTRKRLRIGQEFTVKYSTVIPRAVNSYHVTVKVPEEIQLRHFVLSSDVDSSAVEETIADIDAVTERFDELRATAPKLLELQLQSIASRLCEIGRRRASDLETYRGYVSDYYRTFTRRRPRFRAPLGAVPARERLRRLPDDRRLVESLDQFAGFYQENRYTKLVDAGVRPQTLRELTTRMRKENVGRDIHVDNDPRENGAHAHWHRRSFGDPNRVGEPVRVEMYAELVDDPPSLASSVSRLLFSLFVLCLGAGVILEPDLLLWHFIPDPDWAKLAKSSNSPLPSADALVTVLLLVPGLLVTRLDIPSRKTVLGRLRLFPQYLAYTALTITSGLALITAVAPSGSLLKPLRLAVAGLFVLFCISLLDWFARTLRRHTLVPSHPVAPRWLWSEITRVPRLGRRQRSCTAEFSNTGPESDV